MVNYFCSMRYFLVLFAAVFFLTSCEHTRHMYKKNKFPVPFEYAVTDSTTGTQDALYAKALKWISTNKDLNVFTIDKQDKAAGRITGKGTLQFATHKILVMVNHETIVYNVEITVKDGRYTCSFTNFEHKSEGVKSGSSYKNEKPKYYNYSFGNLTQEDPKGTDLKRWDKIKDETTVEAKKVLRSFRNTMMK